MTNNEELALKMKAAAEKALPAIEKYESGQIDGDDALEMLSDFTDVIKSANILSLLAEREADKKVIAENAVLFETLRQEVLALERDVDAANARVDTKCAQLCNQDEQIEMLSQRIAELEALTSEQDKRLIAYAAIATKNASEDRTLSVKLPKPHAHLIWIQAGRGPDDYWDDVAVSHSLKDRCCDGSERYPVYSIFEIQDACAAAGIKLEVGSNHDNTTEPGASGRETA